MKFKKGMIILFRDREETIEKASNDPIRGMVKTNLNEYSVDFLNRWLEFGFITIKSK